MEAEKQSQHYAGNKSNLECCAQQGMTLVEMFAKFDADGSMSVTHDEFREGIKEAKIPLTALHVDKLIESLDQDGDGEIDFSELVIGAEEKGGGARGSAKPKSSPRVSETNSTNNTTNDATDDTTNTSENDHANDSSVAT